MADDSDDRDVIVDEDEEEHEEEEEGEEEEEIGDAEEKIEEKPKGKAKKTAEKKPRRSKHALIKPPTFDEEKAREIKILDKAFITAPTQVRLSPSYIIDNDMLKGVKKIHIVPPENRITSRYLTLYEVARILCIRASQIDLNGITFCKDSKAETPIDKAIVELTAKKCPLTLVRKLSDKYVEYWDVNDMIIPIKQFPYDRLNPQLESLLTTTSKSLDTITDISGPMASGGDSDEKLDVIF